jgi:transketolase
MTTAETIKSMQIMSAKIRIETIRQLMEIGFGHIGGSMSIADVLGVLYGGVMRIDPKNPDWEDRDYFVCSKGHAGPAVYAALALNGYFPMDWLKTLNKPGTKLPSHCDRTKTPGIDMTAGSLGQGISAAVGIALGARISGKDSYTYCIVGDGECQEGLIWEAVMFAAHCKLGNLILFVDYNKKQIDGTIAQVNDITNFTERFISFRWDAQQVNGHDCEAIYNAIQKAKQVKDKPSVIVLDTKKGKGCSFVEDLGYNHYVPMPREECEAEINNLENYIAAINK